MPLQSLHIKPLKSAAPHKDGTISSAYPSSLWVNFHNTTGGDRNNDAITLRLNLGARSRVYYTQTHHKRTAKRNLKSLKMTVCRRQV